MNPIKLLLLALCVAAAATSAPAAPGDFLSAIENPTDVGTGWDGFGTSIAVAEGKIVVSAHGTRVYVFDAASGEELFTLESAAIDKGSDGFGAEVSLINGNIVVGAPYGGYFYDPVLAGIGYAGSVQVFDASTGEFLRMLHNPIVDTQGPGSGYNRIFGKAITACGDDFLISAPADLSPYYGEPFVYLIDGTTGENLFTFSDPAINQYRDLFGAVTAVDGNSIVIGSTQWEDLVDHTQMSGRVYVYDRESKQLRFTLDDPTRRTYTYFGSAVAATDGRIAVSAAVYNAPDENFAYYIFDAQSGALLNTIQNPNLGLEFGARLEAYGNDFVAGVNGAAHVIDPVTGVLTLTINNPTTNLLNRFGTSLAVMNGEIFVGAPWDDGRGFRSGRIHRFNGSGESQGVLDNPAEVEDAAFGHTLAAIGDRVIVGARFDDSAGTNAGAIYAFDSAGVLQGTFLDPSPEAEASFGYVLEIVDGNIWTLSKGKARLVDGLTGNTLLTIQSPYPKHGFSSLSAEGGKILLGVAGFNPGPNYTTDNTGRALLYNGSTGELLLTLDNPRVGRNQYFGRPVLATGNKLWVAAAGTVSGEYPGTVHVFDAATGELELTLDAPDPVNRPLFGSAMIAAGNVVAISAPRHGATGSWGTVYLYDATTGEMIRTIRNPDSEYYSFGYRLAQVGESIAISSTTNTDVGGRGTVSFYDAVSGKLQLALRDPANGANDGFGAAVSSYGSNILVSAPGHPNEEPYRMGTVYQLEGLPLYSGRSAGDLDDSRCTDLLDFFILIDYWQSEFAGSIIGASDYLAVLDHWHSGGGCR